MPCIRFLWPAVLMLSIASPFAYGQSSGPAADQIATLLVKYDSSWNVQDTAGASRLMAPRYQYFTSRGDVRPRAEMLSFLGDPEYKLASAKRSEVVVTQSGPVAVVSTRWQGHGTYKGERFIDDQRCGLVWVLTSGTWKLLNEHCVQIAPKSRT